MVLPDTPCLLPSTSNRGTRRGRVCVWVSLQWSGQRHQTFERIASKTLCWSAPTLPPSEQRMVASHDTLFFCWYAKEGLIIVYMQSYAIQCKHAYYSVTSCLQNNVGVNKNIHYWATKSILYEMISNVAEYWTTRVVTILSMWFVANCKSFQFIYCTSMASYRGWGLRKLYIDVI